MTGAVILCGGRSSRMGRPKAWLPFGDETCLARVARVAAAACEVVMVVAAPGQDLPPLPSAVRIAHDAEEGLGPLKGLEAGLLALPDGLQSIHLTSCDAPLINAAYIRRVRHLLGPHDVAIPVLEGVPQPLAAAWRVGGLLERVRHTLSSGRGGLVDLLVGADVRRIEADDLREVDPELDSLRSFNTPDEYDAVLKRLRNQQ